MIETYSAFIYGYEVTQENFYLNFKEGAFFYTAKLLPSKYTLTTLAQEISRAMNSVGSQPYSVVINRTTRQYTIQASGNFDLLCLTGANVGQGIWDLIGFDTSSDKTSLSTYTSDYNTGTVYYPQLPLQDFVDADNNQEYLSSNVNEAVDGSVELYSIGVVSEYDFNIKYANNLECDSGAFRKDPDAILNLNNFMRFAIKKAPMELIEDVDDFNSYETIFLIKTKASQNGTSYKLKEIRNVNGYYETGSLTFRRV